MITQSETIVLETGEAKEKETGVESSRAFVEQRLVINSSRIRLLQETWQKRWNRLPSAREMDSLVDSWIHDEVLYRESLRRGLDRNDEIVRRRLVQKMQNLSFRLSWTEPLTPQEVEDYYATNKELFLSPSRRSFSHIYFSRAKRGDETQQDALEVLELLSDVLADTEPSNLGDRFMLPGYFAQLTQSDVRHQFGVDFAIALFDAVPGKWDGPISSAYGLHLVTIHEETQAYLPPLVDIELQVLEALNSERQQVAIEHLFQSFRDNFEIVFDTEDERNYEDEINSLAVTWLNQQEDTQESQAKLKEIYNKVNAILPPRYQGRFENVSAAPMSAADLIFDEDGKVAWDKIWGADDPNQPFCELAIAGGPAHRGTLLEPVSPEEAVSDLDRYGYVLQELARGITMVTSRAVVISRTPGWIGVQCDSEEMAIWVLRGIIVENVMVRREDSVLYLPASPKYSLQSEIKNVVTACAKVFHYWNEHIAALEDDHEAQEQQ